MSVNTRVWLFFCLSKRELLMYQFHGWWWELLEKWWFQAMTWNQVVSYISEPSGLFRTARDAWILNNLCYRKCLSRFNVHICHLGSCENTDSTGLRWAPRFHILTNPSDVSATGLWTILWIASQGGHWKIRIWFSTLPCVGLMSLPS